MRRKKEELIFGQWSASCCAVALLRVLLQRACWRRWCAGCLTVASGLVLTHCLLFPCLPRVTWWSITLSSQRLPGHGRIYLQGQLCFPWSRGSQLSSGSSMVKMAVFPATRLWAMTSPGTEPCKRDLDGAQPAWDVAEKVPDCLGLSGCHTPPSRLYTQSLEGDDPGTMFSTQCSLLNITKSCCRQLVKFSSPSFQAKALTTRNRSCCITAGAWSSFISQGWPEVRRHTWEVVSPSPSAWLAGTKEMSKSDRYPELPCKVWKRVGWTVAKSGSGIRKGVWPL